MSITRFSPLPEREPCSESDRVDERCLYASAGLRPVPVLQPNDERRQEVRRHTLVGPSDLLGARS